MGRRRREDRAMRPLHQYTPSLRGVGCACGSGRGGCGNTGEYGAPVALPAALHVARLPSLVLLVLLLQLSSA